MSPAINERPIRILMLLENAGYPDDSRVLLEAESLVDAGYEVTVVCPTDCETRWRERVGRVNVRRYPKPLELGGFIGYVFEYAYSMLAQWIWSVCIFARGGFDVIHMHTPPDMNALIPAFFKLFGKRFVYDLHDLSPELFQAQRDGDGSKWVHRTLLFFERFACRRANRLIATNQSQQDVQTGRGGALPEHCYIVRNGPSEAFLGDVQPLPELAMEGGIVIGYVGVIGIQDGVDYLIRALDVLKNQRNRDDFRCVIVGSGAALETLKRLANELGVSEQVNFVGRVPFSDVPRYIASFDVCTTPDHSNPYNDSCTTIKTMEYMALCKPTVCFETRENVKTAGDAALYATSNSVEEFANQLERLMDDASLREAMGKYARLRIEDGLLWAHQSKQLVALYDGLFPGRTGRGQNEMHPEEARHDKDQAEGDQARDCAAIT